MSTPRQDVITAVSEERDRQDAKWGGDFAGRSDTFWLAILLEEVGEIARAIIERDPDAHIEEEILQSAAVCLSWLEYRTPTASQTAQGIERGGSTR